METATTPMLKQYHAIKHKHADCILFFRLGDFYEMFFEDAKIVSQKLDLVLTSRGKTQSSKIPMCGFPHHAAENYIAKLVKFGFKIAICEQVEDPAAATGIVKRDVVRIITTGTYLDNNSDQARLLLCLAPSKNKIGLAFCDPTSGQIQTNQFDFNTPFLVGLIGRLPIFECLYPESAKEDIQTLFNDPTLKNKNITLSPFEDWCFNAEIANKALCEHFLLANLHGFNIEDKPLATTSCSALLEYLKQMNKQPLKHIDKISLYTDNDYVFISPAALRGLEYHDFITTLDYTISALGRRLFHFWMTHPLKNRERIVVRQDAVTTLLEKDDVKKTLRSFFKQIPDLEKSISRLSCGYTHPKDLSAIRNTLELIPNICKSTTPLSYNNALFSLNDIPELRTKLCEAINQEIPLAHPEGKIIKTGYHAPLDELRNIQQNGREWLQKLQQAEIKKTGINSLKIGFNKVFGYYIEITKANAAAVPDYFIRKQTLVNAERYITPELKEYEEKILTAQDKIQKIENDLVKDLVNMILDHSQELHALTIHLATIDVLCALSTLAESDLYCRPNITEDPNIDIKDGRHPVVEKTVIDSFVPNDTLLNCTDQHLIILTGPNMAGKSTYIRQSALLVILAQVGSYLPASSATIGIVDKVFTRIGAHDDISKGQSTFMVEMNEMADILNNMTDRSLLILDEIGRGTSTYDGLSLAWALAEHLRKSKARTLFATHFHELTALSDKHDGVSNYNVSVKEWKDEIIFLHKIIPGSTDDSYGIYVAKLAGIPTSVIARAKSVLTQLELKQDLKQELKDHDQENTSNQLDLFTSTADPIAATIKKTIAAMDIDHLTPIKALNAIGELKDLIKKD